MAGAVLLKAAECVYGLVKAFARCLVDKHAPDQIRHTLEDLLGQRVFSIACGHADNKGGDRPADDPIHKLLLGRDPVASERLAEVDPIARTGTGFRCCRSCHHGSSPDGPPPPCCWSRSTTGPMATRTSRDSANTSTGIDLLRVALSRATDRLEQSAELLGDAALYDAADLIEQFAGDALEEERVQAGTNDARALIYTAPRRYCQPSSPRTSRAWCGGTKCRDT